MHPENNLSAMRTLNLGPDRVRQKSYLGRVRKEEGSNTWEKICSDCSQEVFGWVSKRGRGKES